MTIHQRTHPTLDVPGCYGCKISSIGIPPSAGGNEAVRAIDSTERQWHKDIGAYKRLRADGLQPRSIDGAHVKEALATTREQVER